MFALLFFICASMASAASLAFTSTDPRCSGASSALTCHFTGAENKSPTSIAGGTSFLPSDFGVALDAVLSGGGTWTIGAENQSTCDAQLVAWWQDTTSPASPAAATTISADGKIYVAPNGGIAGKCNPGDYTHTITLTNGSDTYTFTIIQTVIFRQAMPLYFNACGVTDASLSGGAQGNCAGGLTQQTPYGGTFTSNLNELPCSGCNPGGTMFTPPSPGGTRRDEFGNLMTVITPSCFVTQGDVEKSNTSRDNTWIIVASFNCDAATYATGLQVIFPTSGAAVPYWVSTGGSQWGSGSYTWSNTADNVFYGFRQQTNFTGTDTPFFRVVLDTSAPPYTVGAGYTVTVDYSLPYASYGWVSEQTFSHQDMNKLNWYAFNTNWEFSGQVSTNGTALTWVSGQQFDTNKLLDQSIVTPGGTATISSCASVTACTLASSLGVQTNVLGYALVPWKVCAVNVALMQSQGVAYTPTCADLTALTRPRIPQTSFLPTYIARDVSSDGLLYLTYNAYSYSVIGAFDPNSPPSTFTIARKWNNLSPTAGFQFGPQCRVQDTSYPPTVSSYCQYQGHATSFQTSDGGQWLLNGAEGAQFTAFRVDADLTQIQRPRPYSGGSGSFYVPIWTQYVGGEYGGARYAPYMVFSGSTLGFGSTPPPSWVVTGCTNANPMVVTVTAASSTGINNTTHNKVLIGGVVGNTNCNGHKTVASVAGANSNVWTLTENGNGAYSGFPGAVEDVSGVLLGVADVDQILVMREMGQEVRRLGHTRSMYYPTAEASSNYYNIPRYTPSFDASLVTGTTNFGIPNSYYVISIATGVGNGTSRTTNQFDATHSVTSAVTSGTNADLSYSTPTTANAVIDICQSLRWPDIPGGSSLDASCQTFTDTSGVNPRTKNFTVTADTAYYYRIVSLDGTSSSTMAWGAFGAPDAPGSKIGGPVKFAGPAVIR